MDREWNTELTKIHQTNYVRNSRAIAVAWFVFSACYTILNIVAFIQPFWFGDTDESPGVGYFGLYEWCEKTQTDYTCTGDFMDFNSLLNDVFRASAFLVGGAALLFIFSIICMILFMFLKARIVLRICGCLQFLAALFMIVGCVIYPAGWDDVHVKRICGQQSDHYSMDKCQIRWAYILAIVLIFDALILATLAFVLAARQAKEIPEFKKLKEDKSHINRGFTGSNIIASTSHQKSPHALRKRHSYTKMEFSNSGANENTQKNGPNFNSNFSSEYNIQSSPNSSQHLSGSSQERSPRSSSLRSQRSKNGSSPRENTDEDDGSVTAGQFESDTNRMVDGTPADKSADIHL